MEGNSSNIGYSFHLLVQYDGEYPCTLPDSTLLTESCFHSREDKYPLSDLRDSDLEPDKIPKFGESIVHELSEDNANTRSTDTCSEQSTNGRPKGKERKLLELFTTQRSGTMPAKFNLIQQYIRGFKSSIRDMLRDKWPSQGSIHNFDRQNSAAFAIYNDLKSFILLYPYLLEDAQTRAGPKSEAMTVRSPTNIAKYKSINESYLRKFFCRKETREAFEIYVKLVFQTEDEDVLAKKMKISPKAQQKEARLLAWRQLKDYLSYDMVSQLSSKRKCKK